VLTGIVDLTDIRYLLDVGAKRSRRIQPARLEGAIRGAQQEISVSTKVSKEMYHFNRNSHFVIMI